MNREYRSFFETINSEYAFDGLSKVYNRQTMQAYVNSLINKNIPFSFAMTDIDNFKYINDTYGHLVGDKVICEYAQFLMDIIGERGIIGRYGGDEFIMVIEEVVEYESIWDILHELSLKLPIKRFDAVSELTITSTTGMSRYPIDAKNREEIVMLADKALYRGKTKGRDCFIIYLPEKHANINLSNTTQVAISTSEVHSKVYSILTETEYLEKNIDTLFEYFVQTLMFDHIGIQLDDSLIHSVVHPLSRVQEFRHIKEDYSSLVNENGVFYVNNTSTIEKSGNPKYAQELKDNSIYATLIAEIRGFSKVYGYIRVDQTVKNRIWQNATIDFVLCAAKLIGTLSYLYNKEKIK